MKRFTEENQVPDWGLSPAFHAWLACTTTAQENTGGTGSGGGGGGGGDGGGGVAADASSDSIMHGTPLTEIAAGTKLDCGADLAKKIAPMLIRSEAPGGRACHGSTAMPVMRAPLEMTSCKFQGPEAER